MKQLLSNNLHKSDCTMVHYFLSHTVSQKNKPLNAVQQTDTFKWNTIKLW